MKKKNSPESPLKNRSLRNKSFVQQTFQTLSPSPSQSPETQMRTISQDRLSSGDENLYPTFSLDSPLDNEQDEVDNSSLSKPFGGFSKFKLIVKGQSPRKVGITSNGSRPLSQTSTKFALDTISTSFNKKTSQGGIFISSLNNLLI